MNVTNRPSLLKIMPRSWIYVFSVAHFLVKISVSSLWQIAVNRRKGHFYLSWRVSLGDNIGWHIVVLIDIASDKLWHGMQSEILIITHWRCTFLYSFHIFNYIIHKNGRMNIEKLRVWTDTLFRIHTVFSTVWIQKRCGAHIFGCMEARLGFHCWSVHRYISKSLHICHKYGTICS